jgi:peptidoglycan/xylan/chitin deacetylase (PgdA/CDA1 family)
LVNGVGAFTLSLDCEGFWGLADQPAVIGGGQIHDRSLARAYALIDRVLDQHGIRATAAFVSCFAAPPEAVRAQLPLIEQMAEQVPSWFSAILPAVREDRWNGWNGRAHFQRLSSRGHEMAWHGATHLCLADQTPAEVVQLELRLLQALRPELGPDVPVSVVFPRNEVGHLDLLAAAGFQVYRMRPPGGLRGRVIGLAREWNMLERASHQRPQVIQGWAALPCGLFLNWPRGARAMVPVAVTVQRWRAMLRDAARTGRDVHMWFHPHNLVTAPAMTVTFEAVMAEVGALVASGDLVVRTMSELGQHAGINNGETS